MKEALKLALEALGAYMSATDSEEDAKAHSLMAEAFFKIKEALAHPEQEPEFFTHSVEQPYEWSEWVCPDPKGYLMKCCDCGLVHEAEFGVVRYKSETEREDCDMVDDPNLQAVFRMRRSEQWSPADMAHRAGGTPMTEPAQQYNATSDHQLMENAQGDLERIKLVQTGVGIGKPEQGPVAWMSPHLKDRDGDLVYDFSMYRDDCYMFPVYKAPPQRKPLTDQEIYKIYRDCGDLNVKINIARAIEAAHGIKEVKSCGS